MALQAIETRYNGYRFRSRLEARWAVFFDTLGVKYEYELEGFELGDGLRYLPDFWLPDLGVFVEVKPVPIERESTSWEKITRFLERNCELVKASLAMVSANPVLLLVGTPTRVTSLNSSNLQLIYLAEYARDTRCIESDHCFWVECPECHHITVTSEFSYTVRWCGHVELAVESRKLLRSYEAARSARFEFGEQGR